MKLDVEAAARIAHEAVRALAIEAGQSHIPLAWDRATDWERDEIRSEIVEVLETPDPAQRWEMWRRGRLRTGWRHGPRLDGREKTDDRLTSSYESLPDFHRQRYALVGAVVESLLPWLR